MDEQSAELNRRITERIDLLNATQGWPWQQPGAMSVGLDDDGQVRRYRATPHGLLVDRDAG